MRKKKTTDDKRLYMASLRMPLGLAQRMKAEADSQYRTVSNLIIAVFSERYKEIDARRKEQGAEVAK